MNEPKKKYHVLARGVITSAEYVLVAHCIGMDNTFLPGGHVKFNEGIKTSLEREIQEELGLESRVGQYLGLVEADFESRSVSSRDQSFVYSVDFGIESYLQSSIERKAS